MTHLYILVIALTGAMVFGYVLYFIRGRMLRRMAEQLHDVQQRLAVLDQREEARQQAYERIYGPPRRRRKLWIVHGVTAAPALLVGWLLLRKQTVAAVLAGVLAGAVGVATLREKPPDPLAAELPRISVPPSIPEPTPSPRAEPTPEPTTRPPETPEAKSTKPGRADSHRTAKPSPQPSAEPTPTVGVTAEPTPTPSVSATVDTGCLELIVLEVCADLGVAVR